MAVEPDSSVRSEVPHEFTGPQLPSVHFKSGGIEDPSNEHKHDTIINMRNLASTIDESHETCDAIEMFPLEVRLCVNKSLRDVLPSSTSDERACTAVGS